MKRILYLIIPFFISLSSCEDFLEVDPKTQIPTEAALTNGKNIESTLISAYSDIVGDDFLGLRVRLYSELLSDNIGLNEVTLSSTDFTGQVALRNTNILNKDVDNVWSAGYRAISKANAVINAIESDLITDNTTDADKSKWIAESKFIRAVAHFELVRLFGKPYSANPTTDLGIPIRIVSLSADEKQPRASVAQVYSQVVDDLLDAAELLPTENGNRADRWSAKGYLSRVYFNMLDYNNAFLISQEFVDEGFQLQGDPLSPFRNNGNITPGGAVFFQVVSPGNSFGDFRPATNRWSLNRAADGIFSILENRGNDDFRFNEMVEANGNRQFSTKWDSDVINPPIIRLAEILLIHAESAILKTSSDLTSASNSYNSVRSFAEFGFAPIVFTSAQEALTSIREERRIELLFEGDRYHELRRLQTASFGQVGSGVNIIREAKAYDDASWLLKIPVSETSGNPTIIQN